MSTPTVRLRLRYRPSADVLSGEVLGTAAPAVTTAVVERPDRDSFLTWSGNHTDARLLAFHLLNPRTRLDADGVVAHLPPALALSVAQVLAAGTAALAREHSVAARITLVTECVVPVVSTDLSRDPVAHAVQTAMTSSPGTSA